MAQVLVKEAPGGLGEAYQCGYCGMTYLAHAVVDGEVDPNVTADPPKECRRCHAPMDYEAVVKVGGFADQEAERQRGAVMKPTKKFRTL